MDELSEVFDAIQVRGLVSGAFAVRGPWISRTPVTAPLKLVALVGGRARLKTDTGDPLDLGPGDVAILRGRSWMEVGGGRGDGPPRVVTPAELDPSAGLAEADRATDDIVIGGHAEVDPAGEALLLRAVPPVALVRGSEAPAADLGGLLDRLFDELVRGRAGSAFAIRQYGQLLLLEVLRAYAEAADLPPGSLRLLTDERLRPALHLMHAQPGRSWGLSDLAKAAAMSRTSFAEQFRAAAGVPPLTYLHHWRMTLARRALRGGDVRVGELAADLGYASESAFSTAFKRDAGLSPLRFRRHARS